ncbi:MAG: hypothetical protein HYV32_05650 [Candidatus Kerfeldbacteria bacterium]|nr:hypothetical protein [Candidatus Kerfeldbacteria bacterium]
MSKFDRMPRPKQEEGEESKHQEKQEVRKVTEILQEKGFARENLYSATVNEWIYKDGAFTGSTEKHHPEGVGWKFKTNVTPEGSSVPYLNELVAQVQNDKDLHELSQNGFVQVSDQPGMKSVRENCTPFVTAYVTE